MPLNKTLTTVAIAAALLSACKPQAATEDVASEPVPAPAATPAPAPAASVEPVATEAAAPAQAAAPFDIASVPLSDKPLLDWPHLAAPAGYELRSARTLDLAQAPFWTGRALQLVEGRVFEAQVSEVDDKAYSRFEVLKRIDEMLTAQGAVKIASGEIPSEVLDNELPRDFRTDLNAGAGGYYNGRESSTYVLRRADRAVWFTVYSGGNSGNLLVAESITQ